MPPRAKKHQLTCLFELNSGSFLIGRWRMLVVPRNHLVGKHYIFMKKTCCSCWAVEKCTLFRSLVFKALQYCIVSCNLVLHNTSVSFLLFLGRDDCVYELIKHGAVVSATNYHGSTPLHSACQRGHKNVAVSFKTIAANNDLLTGLLGPY